MRLVLKVSIVLYNYGVLVLPWLVCADLILINTISLLLMHQNTCRYLMYTVHKKPKWQILTMTFRSRRKLNSFVVRTALLYSAYLLTSTLESYVNRCI